MIYDRTWHVANMTGRSFEDLVGRANEVFMEAVGASPMPKNQWNGEGKFSGWLYKLLTWELMNYAKKLDPPMEVEPSDLENMYATDLTARDSVGFRDEMGTWSEEARYVARLILEGPAEALGLLGGEPPQKVKGKLRTHLRKEGWSWPRIWGVMSELRTALSGRS